MCLHSTCSTGEVQSEAEVFLFRHRYMAASVVSIWLTHVPPQLLLQVCMQHNSNLAAVGFSMHAVQQRS